MEASEEWEIQKRLMPGQVVEADSVQFEQEVSSIKFVKPGDLQTVMNWIVIILKEVKTL
ncbi:DUF3898 domain-containing protein [Metabacillus fastidiosus]|uniref:DUF3898 domain-containing protein n=1 Tax=Metabacillus fastidiosus TaxID=1458 RepID=UPI002E1CBA4A|nr:DUF3898 domain-containing protein [Metabacillus fastidiosus]